MPKKVPLISVGVAREGKTTYPPVGQPFDFTKEEIADMEALAKKDGIEYFRNPVNEAADAPAGDEKAAAKKTDGKGGKTGGNDNL